MKLSYQWLKELVPDLVAGPEDVAQSLTLHAFETVVLREIAIDPTIRVVKITNVEPHPNANRLRLATISDGQETWRVVCGAPNIEVGQVVPYAPPGAKVHDAAGQPFVVTEATIRGERSPGMLASARELGLGSDHGGIFVLPADTPLGSRLADHLPNDFILETDITPNRAHDSLSYLGVARELAALYGLRVKEPELGELPATVSEVLGYTLAIEDAADTPRYMNVLFEGAEATTSPLWMQVRLLTSGVRPINAIVDSTNYVLLEHGQPNHAFDRAKLPGKSTGVRRARKAEKLTLLDGQEINLPAGALLITSNDTPVALAGIMGGVSAEVGEETTDLLLEVANFRPFAIQQTAAALSVHTEAAARFAKGLAPSLVETAAQRLIYLLQELTGATVMGVLDQYPAPAEPVVVSLRPEHVSRVAGTTVTADQSRQTLERLRFKVLATTNPWQVTVPRDRLDVMGEHDLVEEVIRLVGLQNIPTKKVEQFTRRSPSEGALAAPIWRENIRDALVEHGFTETYNLSFELSLIASLFGASPARIEIANPLSPEQKYLRTSLLPGLVANFITNKDDFHTKFQGRAKALFEIGHVYLPADDPGTRVPGVREEERVAGMVVGTKEESAPVVQAILQRLGNEEDTVVLYHSELPAEVVAKMKYRVPVTAFELKAAALYEDAPPLPYTPRTLEDLAAEAEPETAARYQEFSRYPSVLRDLSFLVEPRVTVEQVQELLERVGGELVVDSDLFDEFTPEGSDLTGLAFHIEYQALNRTLTTEEITEVHNRIIEALEADLGAQMR